MHYCGQTYSNYLKPRLCCHSSQLWSFFLGTCFFLQVLQVLQVHQSTKKHVYLASNCHQQKMYLDLWLYHVVSCLETSFWRNNFVERIDEDSICLGGLPTNQEPP